MPIRFYKNLRILSPRLTISGLRKESKRGEKKLNQKKCKIYAFSSIMRISNNNYNIEEKKYWSKYGKKIFKYSFETHRFGRESGVSRSIPKDILEDYLETRKRNFRINKIYLNWQKEGLFDTLVFSKDDCAQYGFNVHEAQVLEDLGGFTKTGAKLIKGKTNRLHRLKIDPLIKKIVKLK